MTSDRLWRPEGEFSVPADSNIKEEICEALRTSNIDASNFEVNVEHGDVTLIGTVESAQLKQMAEELIENLSGVQAVSNQLKVKQEQDERRSHDEPTLNGGRAA